MPLADRRFSARLRRSRKSDRNAKGALRFPKPCSGQAGQVPQYPDRNFLRRDWLDENSLCHDGPVDSRERSCKGVRHPQEQARGTWHLKVRRAKWDCSKLESC